MHPNQNLRTRNQNPLVMMETRDTLDQVSFAQHNGTIYLSKLSTSEFYSKVTWGHKHMQTITL